MNSYLEFKEEVLPRIRRLGYNAIQIMAIQEHAWVALFLGVETPLLGGKRSQFVAIQPPEMARPVCNVPETAQRGGHSCACFIALFPLRVGAPGHIPPKTPTQSPNPHNPRPPHPPPNLPTPHDKTTQLLRLLWLPRDQLFRRLLALRHPRRAQGRGGLFWGVGFGGAGFWGEMALGGGWLGLEGIRAQNPLSTPTPPNSPPTQ